MSDELESCCRCSDLFESRELNDVGLCPGCVVDEAAQERLRKGIKAMSNTPYDRDQK